MEIARYTIDLDEELNSKLDDYMKRNKIKLRSVAIKECINKISNQEAIDSIMTELDKKYNRILYRINLNKKLLEQIFVNTGFQINETIDDDKLLKEFYETNNKYRKYD